MTFKDRQFNSMTFQAWKMKFLNSITLKVFHDLCVSFYVGGSTSFATSDWNWDKKYPREKRYSCWTLHRELSRENIITARLARGRNSSRKLLSLLKVLSVRVRRWVTWSETTQIKLSAAEYELVSHVWTLIFKFHCRKSIWRPSLIL